MTINTTESIIKSTTDNLVKAFKDTNYKVTLTEEYSIIIESNSETKPSIHMFNIRTITPECEHRQRFIIVNELNGKLLNKITYYNCAKACKHIINESLDLIDNVLVYN